MEKSCFDRKGKAEINLCVIFFLLLITISCSNNNQNKSNSNYSIKDRLEYLHSLGCEFYEKLDTFSLKGINAIDTSNIRYPFYAISVSGDSEFPYIDIQYFTSSKNVSYRSYRKVNNYYISTKIIVDEELSDFFSREVTIIHPDKIILYNYFIERDFERLSEISFLYKNGNKKVYCNTIDSYYNICDTLNEENIKTLFPTMELSQHYK